MGGAPASNELVIASPKRKLKEAIRFYCFSKIVTLFRYI